MFPGLRPKRGSAGASPSRLTRRIYHKKRETCEPETALHASQLDVDLPVETGMRPIAIRRDDEWDFEVEPEDVLRCPLGQGVNRQ